MAEQLIENLAEPFDPSRYTDDYRANLMKIIKAKMKGKNAEARGAAKRIADTGVLDLMSKLKASLEQGGAQENSAAKKTTRSETRSVDAPAKRKTA